MATIRSLNKSISEMSGEEAFELVRALRMSRRIRKTTTKVVRASSPKSPRKKIAPKKPIDILNALTPEQKKKLLEMVGGAK